MACAHSAGDASASELALGRMPLFSRLTREQLGHVALAARSHRLVRGEVLFHAGQPCEACFGVIGGQVTLTLSSAGGGEKVLEIISAGETFGEAVMFAGRPYPVTATALATTQLVEIPARVVLDLIATDPTFARRMLAGMAVRLHTMIGDVEAMALRSGRQRVAGLLLSLAGDRPGSGVCVVLPAGKAVVASRLSLTPETFSRTLRALVADRLIAVDRRRITLLDVSALSRAADATGDARDG